MRRTLLLGKLGKWSFQALQIHGGKLWKADGTAYEKTSSLSFHHAFTYALSKGNFIFFKLINVYYKPSNYILICWFGSLFRGKKPSCFGLIYLRFIHPFKQLHTTILLIFFQLMSTKTSCQWQCPFKIPVTFYFFVSSVRLHILDILFTSHFLYTCSYSASISIIVPSCLFFSPLFLYQYYFFFLESSVSLSHLYKFSLCISNLPHAFNNRPIIHKDLHIILWLEFQTHKFSYTLKNSI